MKQAVLDASVVLEWYLALAEAERIPFITADEGLYKAVKKDLHWVKWLGEIKHLFTRS